MLAGGVAVAWMAHGGGGSERFFFWNHFVSELGWEGHSPRAQVYNGMLAAGSLFFAPVSQALGFYFGTRRGRVAAGLGVAATLAACGVGLFPMNRIAPHLAATGILFALCLGAIGLFTAEFWRERGKKFSWMMLGMGGLVAFFCVLLLLAPKGDLLAAIRAVAQQQPFYRPEIWWPAVAEWMLVLSVWLWMAMATGVLWSGRSRR